MATRKPYYPGRDLAWLEERLQELQEDEVSGTVTTAWGHGDSNASKQVVLSIDERKRRLLNDLSILDPDKYPPELSVQNTRVRITFNTSTPL